MKEVCLACPGNLYHFPGLRDDEIPVTDYRVLPTRYPFYFKVAQNEFEQILREHLYANYSVRPEYGHELVEVSSTLESTQTVIRSADGKKQKETYRYVIGCDGVRSFVREAAGIKFVGRVVSAMAMMDVPLTGVNFDDRWMNYFFNRDLFINCTRMPGNVWRIYMSEGTGEYVYAEDKRKAFQEVVDKIGVPIKLGEPEWATAWEIRNNIAERYRSGRLIICGDASHVHSPSGGQGMNGCMQDAFNLGWKLAAVLQGHAQQIILDTYEVERRPIGEQISRGAQENHDIVMGFGVDLDKRLAMTKVPNWERDTINLVSGLAHNYRDVVTIPSGLSFVAGPRAGERAPDALLVKSPQRYLYDLFRRPSFIALVVPGTEELQHLQLATQLREEMTRQFGDRINTILISARKDTDFSPDFRFRSEECDMFEKYEIGQEGRVIIVRPDLYVGMTCVPEEWRATLEYMGQWFTAVEASTLAA